jgi:hypothetical protein
MKAYFRFQVLMAASMKMTVFWDTAPVVLLKQTMFKGSILPPSTAQWEAVHTFETLVSFNETKRRYSPENCRLRKHIYLNIFWGFNTAYIEKTLWNPHTNF